MKSKIDNKVILDARKEYGSRIRQLRISRGLTQEQLAEKVGTIHQTISKIENGKWAFSVDTVTALGQALDFKVDFTDNLEKEKAVLPLEIPVQHTFSAHQEVISRPYQIGESPLQRIPMLREALVGNGPKQGRYRP